MGVLVRETSEPGAKCKLTQACLRYCLPPATSEALVPRIFGVLKAPRDDADRSDSAVATAAATTQRKRNLTDNTQPVPSLKHCHCFHRSNTTMVTPTMTANGASCLGDHIRIRFRKRGREEEPEKKLLSLCLRDQTTKKKEVQLKTLLVRITVNGFHFFWNLIEIY